jgi:hypothetical protein
MVAMVWFRGVIEAIDRLALKAQSDAHVDGRYDSIVYYGATTVIILELLVGWVLAAEITHWLFWLVF